MSLFYIHIFSYFAKLLFGTIKIIMRTQKIIKKVIFALFLLQKVKLRKSIKKKMAYI